MAKKNDGEEATTTATSSTKKEATTIKFTDLNIANFLAYLTNTDIGENQILDFRKDMIICRAHTVDRTFIKYTKVDIQDVLKYESLPKDFELLKLPMFRLKKLKDTLIVFKNSNIDKASGEITYEKSSDDNSLIGLSIKLSSKSMKVTIKAMDYYLASYMNDEVWSRFYNQDNVIVKFDAKKDFINKLSSLCSLDNSGDAEKSKDKVPAFILKINADKKILVFSSKTPNNWMLKYDTEDGNQDIKAKSDLTVVIKKQMLDEMPSTFYDIIITNNVHINQTLMIMYQDDSCIMLNALLEYDPNEK